MVAEDLPRQLILPSRSLKKSFTEGIDNTGLEKYERLSVDGSDRLIESFVSRQEELIITDPWQESI